MSNLFANNDSEEECGFKTNNQYAKVYDSWRSKEVLNKLKSKYGENVTLEDYQNDSNTSDDDEDAKELTEQVEKDFFKTLSCLKNKDPRIYDDNVRFFNDSNASVVTKSKNKPEKPFTIRDQNRKLLLEKGDIESDDDDRPKSPTYVEEQEHLRNTLVKVVHDDDDDDNNWGGMFQKREKTKEQETTEEETYKQWLAGQSKTLKDKNEEVELKPLKEYWTDPKLDPKEIFLRDYLLNKKFLDNDDASYIPSYEEIVHDSDEGLSEDEMNIDKQEEFERKYNFRFEEPDHDLLKRYPRTMEHSVRIKDDRRKQKRAEVKDRKLADKAKKQEELKQLKALKRKEIEAKLQQLRELTGNDHVGFDNNDIEEDFNSEAYDARMRQLFNDDYYHVDEGDVKPVFPHDDELEEENWDNWQNDDCNGDAGDEFDSISAPHCEDKNFVMDCDYDPVAAKIHHQQKMIENSGGRNRKKKQSKFAEVMNKKKPIFDPEKKSYDEYIEEYYKLDYEDLIGDLPCRFKYRETVPNSFGLTIGEILCAKDKELNSWCSLKKAIQIRPDHIEKYDVEAFKKRAQNEALKRKTFKSFYVEDPLVDSSSQQESLTKKKKRKQKNKLKHQMIRSGDLANGNGKTVAITVSDKTSKIKVQETEIADVVDSRNAVVEPKARNKKSKERIEVDPKAQNKKLKEKIEIEPKVQNKNLKERIEVEQITTENHNEPNKKRKKKKESVQEPTTNSVQNKTNTNEEVIPDEATESQKDNKSRKKNKHKITNKSTNSHERHMHKKSHTDMKAKIKNATDVDLSEARLRAYGFNPKKFKNKQKFGSDWN